MFTTVNFLLITTFTTSHKFWCIVLCLHMFQCTLLIFCVISSLTYCLFTCCPFINTIILQVLPGHVGAQLETIFPNLYFFFFANGFVHVPKFGLIGCSFSSNPHSHWWKTRKMATSWAAMLESMYERWQSQAIIMDSCVILQIIMFYQS